MCSSRITLWTRRAVVSTAKGQAERLIHSWTVERAAWGEGGVEEGGRRGEEG